ncbi:esterase FE4-like [Trichoplusia ni]|uniref:Esterase FE4-like n=1 Tax=Trichoplusia ni TaxID=7111 RepID=A0A7E5W3A0_TRINI|nr:esterase FE4-like [Trichoplusia ni]XP_026735074.1 esterase FE4-like [Trichoplusia ni]XP_026735075.1 esterase FE4-like [Trichoplusia ni]
MSCQIDVKQGRLQGKECVTFYGKKYYSFEGIPYAKPPVGKLRFKAPEPPENWTGIRDATKPGNKCCQLNPYSNTAMEGSEDCLYLNVYTPSLPHEKIEKLPVLFFVHGGRFIFGYGHYYKPDYYLKHDVILVTINYRLSILGFLCLNIPEVPGNAALKDTVMALKWVRDNISNFNGDFNNVTVFGESAGAGAVSSYMTSKMAAGLYHKVIAQSGNSIADVYMVDDDPIEKAKTVVSYLGKHLTDERELYNYLLEVPIEDLMVAFSLAELNRHPTAIQAYFLPVVEKEFDGVERFFEECPRIDIPMNRLDKVPVLTGMNSHEGALFLQKDNDGNIIFENDFYYYIPNYLKIKRDDKRVGEIVKKLRNYYFNGKEVGQSKKLEYVNMLSDKYFQYSLQLLPEILCRSVKEVYFYKFQFSGNLNTRVMKKLGLEGATHGDVIQYQFYRKAKHDKCDENDLKIVEMFSEAWCTFARYGKPTWNGGKSEWLPYTKKDKHSLIIDKEIKLMKNPDYDRLRFWLGITGETSKL